MSEVRCYDMYVCEKNNKIKAGNLLYERGDNYKIQKSSWNISGKELVENYKIYYDKNGNYSRIQYELKSDRYNAEVDAKCKKNRIIASALVNGLTKKVVYKADDKTYFCDDLFYSLEELDEIVGDYNVFTFKSRQIQQIEIKYLCKESIKLNDEKIEVKRYRIDQDGTSIYILLDSLNRVVKLINNVVLIEFTASR